MQKEKILETGRQLTGQAKYEGRLKDRQSYFKCMHGRHTRIEDLLNADKQDVDAGLGIKRTGCRTETKPGKLQNRT